MWSSRAKSYVAAPRKCSPFYTTAGCSIVYQERNTKGDGWKDGRGVVVSACKGRRSLSPGRIFRQLWLKRTGRNKTRQKMPSPSNFVVTVSIKTFATRVQCLAKIRLSRPRENGDSKVVFLC